MSEIYFPREDSYLLSEVLKKQIPKLLAKNKNLKTIEIGIGNGIQLLTLKNLGAKNIFGADINKEAVQHCKNLGFNCIYSDLFETFERKVKRRKPWFPRKFNVIIFNPPYLPLDSKEPEDSRTATTGGKKGGELISRFLMQSKSHLEKNGKIFILISSLTKGIDFSGYRKKVIGRKKMFLEELYVWELRKNY